MGIAGYTCDNLVGAELVTADGRVLEADESRHADLLWALRGGGGNFGVVTRFDYRLHPIGPMYGGEIRFAGDDVRRALERLAEHAPEAPDELMVIAVTHTQNGGPAISFQVAYAGDPAAGTASLAPIVEGLDPYETTLGARTYLEIQAINAVMEFGYRHYWKGTFVGDMDGGWIDAIVRAQTDAPGEYDGVLIEPIHGVARRLDPGTAAFAQRNARWHVTTIAIWEDATEDDAQIAWARRLVAELKPWASGGGYVNYQPPEDATVTALDRGRAAYAGSFDRLREMKRQYDPDNVFRANLNIPPA